MKLNVITRCSRPHHMIEVESSLTKSCKDIELRWTILLDTSSVHEIETSFIENFKKYDLRFVKSEKGDMSHSNINKVLDEIPDDEWVYVLDDDNIMIPEMIISVTKAIEENPEKKGVIFSQYVGGKDFSGLLIREAKPENVRVQHIDMAQFVLKKSLIGEKRLLPMTYTADGLFIEELFRDFPEDFVFVEKVVCYYNFLTNLSKGKFLPKVVALGTNKELKTYKRSSYESDDLNVFYTNDEDSIPTISEKDPDCILTVGESYQNFPSLRKLSPDMRLRWIHTDNEDHAGEIAYVCSMNYILKSSVENEMVSVFTPIYNTGKKILRTYSSLANQTHQNWEWVVVNDSNNLETMKILRDFKDPRIKIYDFRDKSEGVIGEVKYRACSMARGKYLVELDHDDYLLPHAIEKVVEAFNKFPDAGFVYTDCAEVDENYNSLTYGDTFAFGYGSYREETHLGRIFKIAVTPKINPATIRHIVGVPNHLRAWRRDVYHSIGGHNRRLSIADDYELLVRTFLSTRMVWVPVGCYLQFQHGGNSQNSARADIQRRVRTIASFYDLQIKKRFEDLGKHDWGHGNDFRNFPKRDGEDENYVNYIHE